MAAHLVKRCTAPAVAAVGIVLSACSAQPGAPDEHAGSARLATTVGGCACPSSGACSDVSFSDVPADNTYVVTTFGGGSDTQSMACGGTADATWAYVADEARFGCGAKLLVSANGMSCVAQVADCGPNQCVELAAANSGCTTSQAVLDASPYITQYLLGVSSAGYSDGMTVTAVLVDPSTPIGCPATIALPDAGAPDAAAPVDASPPPIEAGADLPDAASPPPPVDASPPPGEDAAVIVNPPAPGVGSQSPSGGSPPPSSQAPFGGANESRGSGCAASGGAPDSGAFVAVGLVLVAAAAMARRRRAQ
jgi:MYXO-CTERM domain-containing protein